MSLMAQVTMSPPRQRRATSTNGDGERALLYRPAERMSCVQKDGELLGSLRAQYILPDRVINAHRAHLVGRTCAA